MLAIAVLWWLARRTYGKNEKVFTAFRMSSKDYKLISTDLQGRNASVTLSWRGVRGIPDAVFFAKNNKSIVCGELKGRKYNGHIRLYEYYQVMLYIGLTQRKYRKPAHGILAYKDCCLKVEFNRDVFEGLMGIANEAKRNKRFFSRVAKPLHERTNLCLPSNIRI